MLRLVINTNQQKLRMILDCAADAACRLEQEMASNRFVHFYHVKQHVINASRIFYDQWCKAPSFANRVVQVN